MHLSFRKELAFEFIATFARFEYALKASGFVLNSNRGVQPDWDGFANSIHEKYVELGLSEKQNEADYLLQNPPKKQALEGECLVFKQQIVDTNQKSTQQLLRFIRTVRNNLFHGGKFIPEDGLARDQRLVESSLEVLKLCINLDNNVMQNYLH